MTFYAQFIIEKHKETNIDLKEVLKYMKMAADKCDVDSMFKYTCHMNDGNIVPVDMKQAAKYFKMAADNGNEISMTQ